MMNYGPCHLQNVDRGVSGRLTFVVSRFVDLRYVQLGLLFPGRPC